MFWFWVSMILLTLSFVTMTMWNLEKQSRLRAKKELNECREKLEERRESDEAAVMRELARANRLEKTREEAEEYRRKYVESVRVQVEMANEIAALVQTIRSFVAQNGDGTGAKQEKRDV